MPFMNELMLERMTADTWKVAEPLTLNKTQLDAVFLEKSHRVRMFKSV